MSQLKSLCISLRASSIAHTATEATDPDMEDDSIEITSKAKDGREISVQVANDFSPRGQSDYLVNLFDGETMSENLETHNPHVVVQRIKELL